MNDCNPFWVLLGFPHRAPFNVLSSWIVFNRAFCMVFLQANTQCLMNVIPLCMGVTSVLVSGSVISSILTSAVTGLLSSTFLLVTYVTLPLTLVTTVPRGKLLRMRSL